MSLSALSVTLGNFLAMYLLATTHAGSTDNVGYKYVKWAYLSKSLSNGRRDTR
jgi:hypothetical protein